MGDCYKYQKLINDSIDNEIDTTGKKQLEDHIKQCASCSTQLQNARIVKHSLKTLPKYKTSTSFELVLRSRLRNEMYKKPAFAPLMWLSSWRPVPAFATLGIIFIFFGYFLANTIQTNKIPTQAPQLVTSNSAAMIENNQAMVIRPAANDGSIKMKNYVNIAEQLPGNHPYARELSEIQSSYNRIQQVQNDTVRRVMPRNLNKPLIRQANTIVHF